MLMLEVIRGAHWRAKRDDAGNAITCETTQEAVEALKDIIVNGEGCGRARCGERIEVLACRNPDGSATIGNRHGFRRVAASESRS